MSSAPVEGARSPLGHCVFGTWEGHTVKGTGAFASPSHDLVAALEFRPQKLAKAEESWFVIPAVAGGVAIRIVGLVVFTRDFKQRDGARGVAVAIPVPQLTATGFSGAIYEAQRLFAAFGHFCIGADDSIDFGRSPEVFSHFQSQPSAPAAVGQQDPLRLRLPAEFIRSISLPELCRVLPQEFMDASARGFILRDAATPEFDHEISPTFLATWAQKQFGPDERRAYEAHLAKIHDAFTEEKRKTGDLSARALALAASLKGVETDLGAQLDTRAKELTEARVRAQALAGEIANARETAQRAESDFARRVKAASEQADQSAKAAAASLQDAERAKAAAEQARRDMATVRGELSNRDRDVRNLTDRAKTAEALVADWQRTGDAKIEAAKRELERQAGAQVQSLSQQLEQARHEADGHREAASAAQNTVREREQTISELRKQLALLRTGGTRIPSGPVPRSLLDQVKALAASGLLVVTGGAATAGAMSVGLFPAPRAAVQTAAPAVATAEDPGLAVVRQKVVQLQNYWHRFNDAPNRRVQDQSAQGLDETFPEVVRKLDQLKGVGCSQVASNQQLAEVNRLLTEEKAAATRTAANNEALVLSKTAEVTKLTNENTNLKKAADARKASACEPPPNATIESDRIANGAAGAGGVVAPKPPSGLGDVVGFVNEQLITAPSAAPGPVPAAASAPPPAAATQGAPADTPPQGGSNATAETNATVTDGNRSAADAAGVGANATGVEFNLPTEPVRKKAQDVLRNCKANNPVRTDKDFIGYGESVAHCTTDKAADRPGRDRCAQYDIGNYYGRLDDFRSCRPLQDMCPGEIQALPLPPTPKTMPARLTPEIVAPFVNLLKCVIKKQS